MHVFVLDAAVARMSRVLTKVFYHARCARVHRAAVLRDVSFSWIKTGQRGLQVISGGFKRGLHVELHGSAGFEVEISGTSVLFARVLDSGGAGSISWKTGLC